jgi:transcriptional regulator with XRE-family HTH domain
MLSRLVSKKMQSENLSLRSAAQQIPTSHTTITRILENKNIDLKTLKLVCSWLGVSTSEVLKDQYDSLSEEEKKPGNQVSILINSNPQLSEAFRHVFASLRAGEIDQRDVEEILSFIAYKLRR